MSFFGSFNFKTLPTLSSLYNVDLCLATSFSLFLLLSLSNMTLDADILLKSIFCPYLPRVIVKKVTRTSSTQECH